MRTCRICRDKFDPVRAMQPTCQRYACQVAYAEKAAGKSAEKRKAEIRKDIRRRKEKIKTRSEWMREAQIAFNAFIRERDKDKPCICCGRRLAGDEIGGGFDAGHYRSVGSAPHLRFDERNVHGQTKQCNRYGAGRAVDYRIGLIARIGSADVADLECNQEVKKYTIDDLKEIKETYKAKLKALKDGPNANW